MDRNKIVHEKQAQVAQAIGHPNRIAILYFLKDGPQCVCDIAKAVGAERSNISRHLSLMVKAGVLESEKQGLKVIYKIKTPCVIQCLECLGQCLIENVKADQKLLEHMQEQQA